MSYDLDLLRVVADKEKYERFKDVVKKHNVSKVTLDVFSVIGDYWENYPGQTTIDWPTLKTFFYIVKSKKLKDPHLYESLFENLEAGHSTGLESAIYERLIKVDYATRIYNEVYSAATGSEDTALANVRPLLDAYDKEIGAATTPESVFVSPSLSYISSAVSSPGLDWRLKELNISLGPLRKGDFIILGARPETGKTTMVASEASFMLPQLQPDEHVFWINNEEASEKVMARSIQAFHGLTTGELNKDIARYESEWLAAGGDRFLVMSDDSGANYVPKLDALFRQYKPGLIVFDQLDKVMGFKNDRDDLRIGGLYKWARDVAKKYCPVIAISQLDGTAEGEKYPGKDKLRGSKTDKPGEADAIILIGDTKEGTLQRYINVDKNKLYGGSVSVEAHRHGKFEIEIDPPRARYVSKWK